MYSLYWYKAGTKVQILTQMALLCPGINRLMSELMLLEDDDPANTTATANASHTSSRPATATAKRPATATAKDTLRGGEARTPGTAATAGTGAAAAQLHPAARGEAFLSASHSGYFPSSTQSIQSVQIVQRGSPNYKTLKTPAPARPAQEAVRARSPQGAQELLRPKSALRFLPAEEFQHTIEVERERERERAIDRARESERERAHTLSR